MVNTSHKFKPKMCHKMIKKYDNMIFNTSARRALKFFTIY